MNKIRQSIADMFENNTPINRCAASYLEYAKAYLESKSIELTGFKYNAHSNVLSVEFDAGAGRALINSFSDSKNDIKEIIDACIKDVKPFDISEHEFSDFSWAINQMSGDFIEFYNHETCTDDGDSETFQVNRIDAIAIAKVLGVTGEDLL